MNGIIRKLKISYPFKVGDSQKVDLYSVEDTSEKFGGNKIHSISEVFDNFMSTFKYQIFVSRGEKIQLWKEITVPNDGVVKEIEYLLK